MERNSDESRKLIRKSKRWLLEYLGCVADENSLSENARKGIIPVMSAEFTRLMSDDDEFYSEVEQFCAKRRYKEEKNAFFFSVARKMVDSGEIHRKYAESDPNYTVPEKFRR